MAFPFGSNNPQEDSTTIIKANDPAVLEDVTEQPEKPEKPAEKLTKKN